MRPRLGVSLHYYSLHMKDREDQKKLMTGTRHQEAARPAARGHYILHSPRDPLADDPSKNRQRDFKCILAYEITLPTSDEFGEVQKELGLASKDAVALQVKDPDVQSGNNPRAASIPREKRAQVSSEVGLILWS